MTQNKWLFTFDSIKDIFINDNIKRYKEEENNILLSKLSLEFIKKSFNYIFTIDNKKNDYKTYVNYILSYSSFKYYNEFDDYLKRHWKSIRYRRIQKKIEVLFKLKIFSKPFASVYFKSFDLNIKNNTDVEDFYEVAISTKF